ncbi:MAG: hypothetical protein J6T72_04650 [Alphaproteobacteria bacterium]|nr:hypothetical protein [Alphaproteobacteria bacterium]
MKKIVRFLVNLLRKIVRAIIYPFRKLLFWLLLIVLAGVYFFPVIKYKIAYTDVVDWYKGKIYKIQEEKAKPTVKKGTDQLVYMETVPEVVTVGRRSFGQPKGAAVVRGVDVLKQQSEDVVAFDAEEERAVGGPDGVQKTEDKFEQKNVSGFAPIQDKKSFVKEKKEPKKLSISAGEYSGLDYLKEPVTVEGAAKVVNVNEVVVGDTYVFLYGIYANPRTENGVKGAVFLRSVLKNERVKCEILAHVVGDGTATAECFVGQESINQMLVDEGFSKKVPVK